MQKIKLPNSCQKMISVALVMFSVSAFADLEFTDVWARATPPGMPMGAVYAVIRNQGDAVIELESLDTPVARAAEVHESIEIDGMMRMREIVPFKIAPGDVVRLEPGGKHMMLMGLKEGLKPGERFALNVRLSDGSTQTIEALVGGFGEMSMPAN